MKKAIKLLCGMMCLLVVMTIVLSACDLTKNPDGSVNIPQGKDQIPVYYGMLLFDSPDIEIPQVNYVDDLSNGKGNNGNNGIVGFELCL